MEDAGGRWERDRINGYLEISRAFGNVDLRCAHSDRPLLELFCYFRSLLTYLYLWEKKLSRRVRRVHVQEGVHVQDAPRAPRSSSEAPRAVR